MITLNKLVKEKKLEGNKPNNLEKLVFDVLKSRNKVKDASLNNIVKRLYDLLDDAQISRYNKNELPSAYILLKRLINSKYKGKTLFALMNVYREKSSEKKPHYGFLEFILDSIENETMVEAELEQYSYYMSSLDDVGELENMVYCLNVINLGFLYFSKKHSYFDLKLESIFKYVKPNLFLLLKKDRAYISRLAIWAFYWISGGFLERNRQLYFSKTELSYFELLANKGQDRMTSLRISVIFIKSNMALFKRMKKKPWAYEWLANLTEKKMDSRLSTTIEFKFSQQVEKVMLNCIDEQDDFWLFEIIIPYLGLMSSKSTIPILNSHLANEARSRITAAIILNGLGEFDITIFEKTLHLEKNNLFYQIEKLLISKSGHLIHKLKAKDTTGLWAYYFVFVKKENERLFLKAIKSKGTINLEHYGRVIGSCYGESPSQELKIRLNKDYGFDL